MKNTPHSLTLNDLSGINIKAGREKAFTLIELLVVVAIIAVLAALIVPAISSLLNSSNRTKCASNLRQIVGATLQCANDNDAVIPNLVTFDFDTTSQGGMTSNGVQLMKTSPAPASIGITLAPYLGFSPTNTSWLSPKSLPSILQCPAVARNKAELLAHGSIMTNNPSYRFNDYASGRITASALAPSLAMLFYDAAWPSSDWPQNTLPHQPAAGLNVAYLDGHVDFMTYAAYQSKSATKNADYWNAFYLNGWFQ